MGILLEMSNSPVMQKGKEVFVRKWAPRLCCV